VAEPDALDAAVEALVQSILAKPAAAVRMGKALVYRSGNWGWKRPTSWQARPWRPT
jgi:enoyl-CoA hydratase/carnithine racemase